MPLKIAESKVNIPFSLDRYRKIYENASIPMFTVGFDGSLVEANQEFVQMLGFSSFAEAKKAKHKLFAEMPVDIVSAIHFERKKSTHDCFMRHRSGHEIGFTITYRVQDQEDQKKVGIEGVVRKGLRVKHALPV